MLEACATIRGVARRSVRGVLTGASAGPGAPVGPRGCLKSRVCPGALRAERGVDGHSSAWQRHVGLWTVAIP